MPDLDVDLVDQFFCPSCIESVFLVFTWHWHLLLIVIPCPFFLEHPQSNLRTTYKQRCLWGLRHPNPDSPKACHKAARGAFSKYCSDECGVKYMQTRVDNWAKKGGKTDKLWESVKNAERREGIVVCAVDLTKMDSESDADGHPIKPNIVRPSKTIIEREAERLNTLLGSIVKIREDIQRGMETVVCRERLLQLASERAEQVGQCGWDQRLCCDDEELADIGAGMLESYEDAKVESVKEEIGDVDMEVDGHDEQWWCPGKKVCDRHAGCVSFFFFVWKELMLNG
jgi:COMPASS component SPP1